jgi:ABC-2 type transport system permease protein
VNELAAAFRVEALKARRSLVPWLCCAVATLPPAALGAMMAIKKDPLHARQLGLLTEKTRMLAGSADWPTFLGFIGQMLGGIGLVVFAILVAWVFGREFSDRTCRIMLATPTRRSAIVSAKMAVAAMWCAVLAVWMLAAAFIIGAAVGMPGLSWPVVRETLTVAARVALLSLALQPVTALVASVGRGYLLPIGWAFVTMMLAQFIGSTGWAAWFPWAIAAASGTPGAHITGGSILVVVLTGLAGLAATVAWWERADQAS